MSRVGLVVDELAADLVLLGDSRDGRGAGERVEGEALSLGGVQSLGGAGSRGVEGLGSRSQQSCNTLYSMRGVRVRAHQPMERRFTRGLVIDPM